MLKILGYSKVYNLFISGDGLMIYQNERWTLRGIISAGVSDPEIGQCKLMEYVVFTDTSSFASWVQSNL